MACKTDKTEINGNVYVATQFPADMGLVMKFRFGKLFKSVLVDLLPLLKAAKNGDASNKIEAFMGILDKLLENDPESMAKFIQDMFRGVKINGTSSFDFGSHFADNYSEMYKVFFWLIKLNFGGFFNALPQNQISRVEQEEKAETPEQTQSEQN